ncbi:hypothetical protein V9L05_06490 [Bernardetia sp. Wsw4-3y2]|uniref:hypothetical protein n=1 Tax=Bernardetia sp. Wsw4-3y2 TaxID=3127471 RepID=UPI0030CC2298
MKNLFYSLLIFSFISCNGNSETKTAESSDLEHNSTSSENETVTENTSTQTNQEITELKTVEDIRAEYQSIMSKITNGKMDSTSFEYSCYEESSGKVIYFLENGQLRMIKHDEGWEHGGVTKEYFLKDNTPFFIFDNTLAWSFDGTTMNGESQTKDKITEKRFYIIDNQLIKCLEKEFTIRSSVKNNPTSETVANKEVNCSDLTELMKDYELVLKYKNQTANMECLE